MLRAKALEPMNPFSPKKTTSVTSLLSLLGGVAFGGFLALELLENQLFLRSLIFTGNQRVSTDALHHLSNIHTSHSMLYFDPERTERELEVHPWIEKAQVTSSYWENLRGSVKVDIKEQSPLMLVSLEKVWYSNEKGVLFKEASTDELDYPILTGIPSNWATEYPSITKRIIEEGAEILIKSSIPLLGGASNISEIHFDRQIGFSLVLSNGSEIVLGFYSVESRLERLQKMIDHDLDLKEPQRIELDADRVAIATPLDQVDSVSSQ